MILKPKDLNRLARLIRCSSKSSQLPFLPPFYRQIMADYGRYLCIVAWRDDNADFWMLLFDPTPSWCCSLGFAMGCSIRMHVWIAFAA